MNGDVMVIEGAEAAKPRGISRSHVAAAAVVGVAVFASYLPNLAYMARGWWNDPNYSFAFLVMPIAGFILWHRREGLAAISPRPSAAGWAALVAILAMRSWLYEENEKWFENATLPLVIASLVLGFAGWRALRWAAPGLAFLLFLLPVPQGFNQFLADQLQTVATVASTALLQVTGLPVVAQGHVIFVGSHPLEVAQACNGLSMLLAFIALITAVTIYVDDRPLWERVGLLASAIPIALVSNILRITATAWCHYLFGAKAGNIAHDWAGLSMMVIALILVWLELKLFSWLMVEEQIDHAASIFIPQPIGVRPIKK